MKNKKPFYKKWWFIAIIFFFVIGTISSMFSDKESSTIVNNDMSESIPESEQTPSPTEITNHSEILEPTETPEPTEESESDDFKYRIYSILLHHKEIANGEKSDAAAKGSWLAYELNLKMYDKNSFEQRIYYYAMYGKDKYLLEFGQDDNHMNEINDYISEILLDHGGDIADPDEYINIQNEQAAQNAEDYKNSAEVISYDDLVREPSKYEGDILKVTIKISQILGGGIITESGYAGTTSGDEWYIAYSTDNEPRIRENDSVTFYGEYTGVKEMTRSVTKTKAYIPRLKAKYHVIN